LQCFAVGLEPLIINAQSQLSASLTSWLVISKRERGQCPLTFSLVCYFRLMDSGITVSTLQTALTMRQWLIMLMLS